MTSVWKRLLSLVFLCELHGLRFILGLSEFIWAFTLSLPGDTFDRPAYAVMAAFMPEWVWAWLFIFMGFCQWLIITCKITTLNFVIVFAGCNSVFWWFVVLSMVFSVTPFPAAISGEIGLAIGAAWIFIRSGMSCVDRKKFDRRRPHDA